MRHNSDGRARVNGAGEIAAPARRSARLDSAAAGRYAEAGQSRVP
jgi:hypothetical protein